MTHSADNTTSVSGPLGSWSLTYDDASRLSSVTYPEGTDSFTYNALGQRMRASLDGTVLRYVYNGDRVLEETSDAGSVLARHTTASGSYYGPWLHMWRSEDVARFPLFDAVGTARGLADASATVTDSYVLDSFGSPTAAATATVNPYRYGGAAGYITDPSGLQQLGARFYWPEVGRFIQQDPLGDGMNSYAYVGNNPVSRIDPEGLKYLDLSGGVGLWPFYPVAGIGPMGGLMLGPDPCATTPVLPHDVGGIPHFAAAAFHKYVHPYVGVQVGTSGVSFSDAPGPQYPSHGLNVQGSAGAVVYGAFGFGLGPKPTTFWERGIGVGASAAVYYVW